MRPLRLSERGLDTPTVSVNQLLSGKASPIDGHTDVSLNNYVEEILSSGFPGLRSLSGRALRAQLDSYISRIVDKDFEEAGYRLRNPCTLRRWFAAYAAAVSTTASFDTLRAAATGGHGNKPSKSTTAPYRDTLERLRVIEPLPAWLPTRSVIAKLASSPKHHLVDPALAARLVGVGYDALLNPQLGGNVGVGGGRLLGLLFESLVTQSLRVYAQYSEATVKHFRTQGGSREVDLIIERADQRIMAVEVKLSRNITNEDVKHLRWLREKIGDDLIDAVVITAGPEAYRRSDGIAVVPAALLGM